MERNIKLAYLICFFRYTWFWFGIWVFYYLLYTDYAGIALIETALIISLVISEIPAGVIADLVGKKRSLLISFFLQATGIGMLALIPSFTTIALGVFIAGIGVSFYSGTLEALVYDSLKQENNEHKYGKVIANLNSINFFAIALCSILGGLMYSLWPPLPTLASALGYVVGFMLTFFIFEPKIDSVKFTFKNSLLQVKHSVHELFKSRNVIRQTILLLSISFIVVIADEMINAFLGVEFGFMEKEAGIFWAIIFLFSSFFSLVTPWVKKRLRFYPAVFILGLLITMTLLVSPFLDKYSGWLSLLFRSSLQVMYLSFVSIGLNSVTESKYRATTLSVFNMLKNIPYILFAYSIGVLSDAFSAKVISAWMGIGLLVLLITQGGLFFRNLKNNRRELISNATITP